MWIVTAGWLIYPDTCNQESIRIYQWASGFAGLHIPKYTVQIINEAWHSKGVYDVEIGCPAFASTTLVNPMVFRRLDLAVCLLYNGRIIKPGEVITFEYSNILPYPFLVLNLKCIWFLFIIFYFFYFLSQNQFILYCVDLIFVFSMFFHSYIYFTTFDYISALL